MTAGPIGVRRPFFESLPDPRAVTGLLFGFRLSFRIGRQDDCEVCIQDDYGSRDHAEMVFEGGAWARSWQCDPYRRRRPSAARCR